MDTVVAIFSPAANSKFPGNRSLFEESVKFGTHMVRNALVDIKNSALRDFSRGCYGNHFNVRNTVR